MWLPHWLAQIKHTPGVYKYLFVHGMHASPAPVTSPSLPHLLTQAVEHVIADKVWPLQLLAISRGGYKARCTTPV